MQGCFLTRPGFPGGRQWHVCLVCVAWHPVLTLHTARAPCPPQPPRCPQVDADEWMYQIAADTDKADPLAVWQRCWECLGDEKAAAAQIVGRYGPALEQLAEFIDARQLIDRPALWLEKAIRCRWGQSTDFPTEPFMSGKQAVLIHYSTADGHGHGHGPSALLSARSSCSANSTLGPNWVPSHTPRAAGARRNSRQRFSFGPASSMRPSSSHRLQVPSLFFAVPEGGRVI